MRVEAIRGGGAPQARAELLPHQLLKLHAITLAPPAAAPPAPPLRAQLARPHGRRRAAAAGAIARLASSVRRTRADDAVVARLVRKSGEAAHNASVLLYLGNASHGFDADQ